MVTIIEDLLSHPPDIGLEDEIDLIGDGILDSMGFLSLATAVQDKLGIEIPFDEYPPEEFTLLGNLIKMCEKALDDNKCRKR